MRRDCAIPSAGGVVVFTPLPPEPNGIADYSAELLPELAAGAPCWVVIDDHAPIPLPSKHYQILRLSTYAARAAEFEQVPHLYQLGNNAGHVYMLPWLARRPGVVVLHDVSLHHLVDMATLRWGDHDAYERMLEREYGLLGRVVGEQFRSVRHRPRTMFYELPMTRAILACAQAVIVHSHYAAIKVASQRADVPVAVIPHHVSEAAVRIGADAHRAQARAALGIDDGTLYVISLGFITKAKQIDTVLRFVARHRGGLPSLRYTIVGQDQPEDFDVRSLVANLGVQHQVSITGYVDEATFFTHVAASDIVVNLRYPSGGETSGTLIRALGAGACVVVNDIGPFAEFPDTVCAKVPMRPGVHEAAFERVMLRLIADPRRRRKLSRAAAAHVRREHAVSASARRYRGLLRPTASQPVARHEPDPECGFLTAARLEAALRSLGPADRQALPLWASTGAAPCARQGHCRVLVLGEAQGQQRLLSALFGYAPESVDAGPAGPPEALPTKPAGSHMLVLLHLPYSTSEALLSAWLERANLRLRVRGHLLLTLYGPSDNSDVEPGIQTCLETAGFAIEMTANHRTSLSFVLDGDQGAPCNREPQSLWRARKISDHVMPRSRAERLR